MEAEDDNQDGEAEEEPLVPDEITDEYFESLNKKINGLIKELQSEQKYTLADEMLRILTVSQRFKNEIHKEQAKIELLNDKVVEANERTEVVTKLSETDHKTIEILKLEIDNAWKQTDIAHSREQHAHEQMGIIAEKLEKLQLQTEKNVEKQDASNEELGSALSKHKEGILRERDRLNAEVEELNHRLKIQRTYTDEVEKKRQESEKKLKDMYKLLDETSDEAFKEKRIIEMLKIQLADTTKERDGREDEAKHYRTQAEMHHKSTLNLQFQVTTCKSQIDKLSNQFRIASDKLTKTTNELEFCTQMKEKLFHDLTQKTNLLKLREDENKKYGMEVNKLVKSKEILNKKMMSLETSKLTLEHEITKNKNIIFTFEKERDASKKSFDNQKKELEKIIRDRDIVRRDFIKANHTIGDQADTILVHEQHIKTLENEILNHIQNDQKLQKIIKQIEKERDRNAEEILTLNNKIENYKDEIHQKINLIEELRENITGLNSKISQIQQMFETARSERNSFQRDLQSCLEDRDDLKEQLKIALKQVEQLQEDIATKDAELLQAEKNISKLERDKQSLKAENQNILVQLQHTKSELKETITENTRLCKTLSEDEVRLIKLRKELDTVLNERDLIGTQLIRRNDEIGLLNEKLHIIQMALDRGESQYTKRMEDIRLLKIEIANLRSQRNLLTRGLANTADMRQEVLQLHRVLTQERVKTKSLEEEMTTPMNIHRWRKLEGKDPDKLDLIVKIQALQKRLLQQTIYATEREEALQETHKLYEALKDFLLKLPTDNVKQRLSATKSILCSKNKKLKSLTAELNAKDMDEKLQECKIEELKTKLTETKKDLIKQKRERDKLAQEHARNNSAHQQMLQNSNYNDYRTVGSGFKIPL